MNYRSIENEVVTRLAPLVAAGYEVSAMPDNNSENILPKHKGVVTVQVGAVKFGEHHSTAEAVVQEEEIFVEIILRAKGLRTTGGIYDLCELCRALLIGWEPSNCRVPFRGIDFGGIDPAELKDGLWTYSLRIATSTMSVGFPEPEVETLITQITIDDSTTLAPAPEVEAFASAYSVVNSGDSIIIAWITENAAEVSIDNGIGIVDPVGSATVSITGDTTFTITATGYGFDTAEVLVTIGINAPDSILEINGDNVAGIASGATLDQQVINTNDDQVGSLDGTDWEVGDATIQNLASSPTWTDSVAAEGTYVVPQATIIDSDGSQQTVDYLPETEGTMFTAAPQATGYQRPADWLEMPAINNGDEKLVFLIAVHEDAPNFNSMRMGMSSGGQFQVDWGDGNTNTYVAWDYAEHEYSWDDISASTLSERGYRQAIATITPVSGTFHTFSADTGHSGASSATTIAGKVHQSGFLDVKFASQNLVSCNAAFQTLSGQMHNLIETFEYVGTNNVTTLNNMFYDSNIKQATGNFPNATNATSMFQNSSIQFCNLTIGAAVCSNMFRNSGIVNFVNVDISQATSISSIFRLCPYLQNVGVQGNPAKMPSGVSWATVFYQCRSLCSVTVDNGSGGQCQPDDLSQTFRDANTLIQIEGIDATNVTTTANGFLNNNCLSVVDIDNLSVTVSFDKSNLSREGIVNIFDRLATVTGSPSITVTNNPGTVDLTPTDLLIAQNKGWTVIN